MKQHEKDGQHPDRRITLFACVGGMVLGMLSAGNLFGGVPASELALIPAGEFWMGDQSMEGYPDERPVRRVHVDDFRIGTREVTFEEWRGVCDWADAHGYSFGNVGKRGWGSGATDHHPVTGVDWYDAVKWCNARSELDKLVPAYYEDVDKSWVYRLGKIDLTAEHVKRDADGYRLPTEAEWEKAARGALEGQYFPWKGADGTFEDHLDPSKANYWPQVRKTTETGSYRSNGYGLHDMAGNVWEWCWDDLGEAEDKGVEQPKIKRVLRGGGWRSVGYLLRCSARFNFEAGKTRGTFGFRVACEVVRQP